MISPKSHDEGCLTKSSVNSNNDPGIFKLDIVECETGLSQERIQLNLFINELIIVVIKSMMKVSNPIRSNKLS